MPESKRSDCSSESPFKVRLSSTHVVSPARGLHLLDSRAVCGRRCHSVLSWRAPLVSVDPPQGVGNYRAAPDVAASAGLRLRFVSVNEHRGRTRGTSQPRSTFGRRPRSGRLVRRGCPSIGPARGPGEESCSARTCLFSGRGCSWKSGALWQPSSGCPGVSRSLC